MVLCYLHSFRLTQDWCSMYSYSMSTTLVVMGNSPRNCDVITGSLANFRLRNAGLKVCGSVGYYARVTRRKIYFIN